MLNRQKNNSNYNQGVFEELNDKQKSDIQTKPYSKTLEEMTLNHLFIEEYYEEYLKIDYKELNNFLENTNTLLKKGYKADEINNIFNLSENNITKLLKKEYLNLYDYWQIKNLDIDNYERYIAYKEKHNLELKDVVTYVNIGVDLEPYANTTITTDPDNYLVLVNKFNGIDKSYQPKDLVSVPGYYGNNVSMRKAAKEALEKLQATVKEEIGTSLLPTTAYRGYSFQATLYNNYVSKDGVKKADTYSARPGFSEHQTGLAIDLKNPKLTDVRLNEKDYDWLKNNAHRFGFIIRFPKDKELLTGYGEENWHIRYVGEEVAKIIYENNLCLEEYIDLYIKEY